MPNSTDSLDPTVSARKITRRRGRRAVYIVKAAARGFHRTTNRASRMLAGTIAAALILTPGSVARAEAAADSTASPTTKWSDLQTTQEEPEPEFFSRFAAKLSDTNGAIVCGAIVILVKTDTLQMWITNSDSEGNIVIENLEPGYYGLRIIAPGFWDATFTRMFVKKGINARIPIRIEPLEVVEPEAKEETRTLPLVAATLEGDLDAIRALIALGVNIDELDKERDGTALSIAVEHGELDAAKLLLTFGADPNARESGGKTPAMRLDDDSTAEMVWELVRNGAKLDLKEEDGETALMHAARYDCAEIVQALIDADADVNATDDDGETALMDAVYGERLENVKLLLLAGADVNVRNKEGQTAMMMAVEENYTEIIEFLAAYGASR